MLISKLRHWQTKLFFGWWVLIAIMILQILIAGLFFQSFGVYVPVLIEEFGWSATGFSIAVSARQLLGAFTGPGIGFAIDRFGSKLIITIGLCLLGIGYLLFSTVQNLFFFILVQLILGFAASLSGWLPNTKMLVNWFTKRRTLALAFMGVGVSIGGLLSPAIAYFIGIYGWRVVAIASGLIMFSGLLLRPLLKSSPEAYGLEPEPPKIAKANTSPELELSASEALRTRSFWFIAFGHSLALMSVVAIIVHYVTHLSSGLGFSLQTAASFFAVLTVMQIVGQLVSGFFGDILSKRWLCTGAMLLHAVGIYLLAIGQSSSIILIGSICHGIAWGARGPLMSAIRADYYGRKDFGKIMGMSDPIVVTGALIGPLIAGYSFDTFGSYELGFTWIASLALIGAICFALASKPKKVMPS